MAVLAAIAVGAILAMVGQQLLEPVPIDTRTEQLLLTVVIVPVWVLMIGASHLFLARAISRIGEEFRHLVFIAQYSELSGCPSDCSAFASRCR